MPIKAIASYSLDVKKPQGASYQIDIKATLQPLGTEVLAMPNLTHVTTYHTIPIYLNKLKKNKGSWLQWVYQGIQYGVPVTTVNEAILKAREVIDATLALQAQAIGRSA